MAAQILKCTQCNIVINELLCFTQNKIDVMDEESLIRIIVSAFSSADISEAKNLLFKSVSTTTRNISRRKNKEQKDIEDIICLFKSTDPEKTPIFVAKELQKLPPVTFDHVDVTSLLKDIILLKSDLNNVKETYATVQYVNDIKNKCNFEHSQAKPSSKIVTQQNQISLLTQKCINNASSDMTLTLSAGALSDEAPPPSAAACAKQQNNTTAQTNAAADVVVDECIQIVTDSNEKTTQAQNLGMLQNMTSDDLGSCNRSIADIVRQGGDWLSTKPDPEWTEFHRRKLRNKQDIVKGKAAIGPEDKFKPAEVKVSLFLSNVHKDTSDKDIVDYIFIKTKQKISLQKIKMKNERPYNAYRIIVNRNLLNLFLNNEVWPDGVTCRRFRPYRTTVPSGD